MNENDLIKQKDTEIDILIRKNEALKDEVSELRAEVETLKNAYKQCAWERDVFAEDTREIKSEARKEFVERLKKDIGEALLESVKTRGRSGFFFAKDVPYHIDNLLAEMEERG